MAASWRIPIGESGLLDFFLGILSVDGLRQSLKIHTLRLIGNSCADEGEIQDQFPLIVVCFTFSLL